MKKYILILIILFIHINNTFSQSVCKQVDEFDGTVVYLMKPMEIDDDESPKDKAFIIYSILKKNTQNKYQLENIMIKSAGVGCVEKGSELTIIFIDETKLILSNFLDSNCDGNAFFSTDFGDYIDLKNKMIKKIRFKNLKNQQTITNLNVSNKNYFKNNLRLIFEASNGMAEIKKCDLNAKF